MNEERLMSKEGLYRELEIMNERELAELETAAKGYLSMLIRLLSFGAITGYTNDAKALLETINKVRMDKSLRQASGRLERNR